MSGPIEYSILEDAIPIFADNVIKMLLREGLLDVRNMYSISPAIQKYAKEYVIKGEQEGYP